MDDLNNYTPSGWRRDLLHIVSCYYTYQVGPVINSRQLEADSQAFIDVMVHRRTTEWLDIKELNPLDYMSYITAVFKEVTGHYLRDLSSYTGWMRVGGYYHWKVAELGQLSRCDKPLDLMDLDNPPQAEAGAGDSHSWYTRSVQEEELK